MSLISTIPFVKPILILASSFLFAIYFPMAHAASSYNEVSPLGINLNAVSYWTPEQPFLDVFKTAGGWLTQNSSTWDTGEQSKLDLDTDGWVKSLSGVNGQSVTYTTVGLLVLRELPATSNGYYPGGHYLVLYDGEGTIKYAFDGVKDAGASSPGRDVLNVTPSDSGIYISITSTDPNHTGNYIRNIRVVRADQEALLQSGDAFNPVFLDRVKKFRVLRFKDWMRTDDGMQSAWNNRPQQSKASYGDDQGVPLEVMLKLSNELQADPWFNMPHQATDDYIIQFATLAHQRLGGSQKAYVEYSNETWNSMYGQTSWVTNQGKATWSASPVTDFEKNRSYFGMRTAQMCDLWKSAWGADANRVVCVMASQAANSWTANNSLSCPLWSGAPCSSNHGIDALAIAPYFGGRGVPSIWTSDPDGGLTDLFTETMQGGLNPSGYPGGLIKEATDWMTANKTVADQFGIDLIAYEGGQHFVNLNDSALTNLYIAANRDVRMGTTYTDYFQQWKNAGGHLFVDFTDFSTNSQWGSWGALESVMQTSSPKYDALMNFIDANPCWWAGCVGTTGTTGTTGDVTPPTIAIAVPSAGAIVSGTTTISANASDNIGVTQVALYAGGTLVGVDTAAPFTFSWNTAQVADGSVAISAKAYDAAGNAGNSGTVGVTVSNTPPTVSLLTPTNGTTVTGMVGISAQVQSKLAVAQITLYIDGVLKSSVAGGNSLAYNWNTRKGAKGKHTIQAIAVDAANHQNSAAILVTTK